MGLMSTQGEIREALARPCVADNSLLSNFVQAGAADLLLSLLGAPVRLSPTVLDPFEVVLGLQTRGPTLSSELLRQLQTSRDEEGVVGLAGFDRSVQANRPPVTQRIQDFAEKLGRQWEPVEPTLEELALATRLSSRAIRAEARATCPELTGRIELDAGEAEAVAIAATRGWTVLIDDQAAVDLLKSFYPGVPIVRTCQLLVHAVDKGTISCQEAAILFNDVMVGALGFYAKRSGRILHLRCDPVRCKWENPR